jgi:hypothetical protein
MAYKSRIVGHGEAAPESLTPHPKNWRKHPQAQRDALAAVLSEVGWVEDIVVNQNTGFIVNGHARVALATQNGESTVPVKYVDLTVAEEEKVLVTLDPLSAMAESEHTALEDLLALVKTDDEALTGMLEALAAETSEGWRGDWDDVENAPGSIAAVEAVIRLRVPLEDESRVRAAVQAALSGWEGIEYL